MMIAPDQQLARQICTARLIKGISIVQMAAELGCSTKLYRRVELGIEPISLVMGAEISLILGVNLRALLWEREEA